MATLCRLEYLTPAGWVKGHGGIALLHPARYVERLDERGKVSRCIELGDDLKPTGVVHTSKLPHDRARLVPDPPSPIPRLGAKPQMCDYCAEVHSEPFDGSCLL